MATLKTALAALRAGEYGAARDALVTVWQKRRSPVSAELVAALDRRAPDKLSAAIAAIVTPRATSSLANLRALAKVDDPRLAAWAIEALVRLPFTAVTARDFLVAVAKTAARHDDPRLAARAQDIAVALTTRIGRLAIRKEIQAIVDKALARMPAVPKTSAADVAIEKELAALVEPLGGERRSAEALLAEIYANPGDDAPRLVYADVLTAQGDPRGEFIVLQIERDNGEPGARELELLKKHGKTWLGDLAPVLSWGKGYATTTFRRGFVSKADIILSVNNKLRPMLAHPAWATVEEIDGLYDDDDELLPHAPLRALEVDHAWLPALAARKEKLTGVVRIAIPHYLPADGKLLRAAFPSVQTVFSYCAKITLDEIAKLAALGIEHVELNQGSEPTGATALRALEAVVAKLVGTPAPIARLTPRHSLSKDSDRFDLRRDANGRYERVE